MSNKIVAAVVLAVVAASAGAGLGVLRRGPPIASSSSSSVESPHPIQERSGIDVHVAGWVNHPGVVTVAEGSIVADAIAAAGGMRPGANAEAINLAAPVSAGQQVVVSGPGDADAPGSVTNTSDGVISLSQASASELETLPGVGPVLAERIVAHREAHGPFESVEGLLEVSGIGESKLASLRDLVRP